MEGHEVEFIPSEWVERACAWPGLLVYSRPIVIERRKGSRRASDRRAGEVARLLLTLLEPI